MYFKKLRGKMLYLSPVDIKDYSEWTKWMNELEGTLYTNTLNMVYTEGAEEEYLKEKSRGYTFAIIDINTDLLIGNIELFDIDQINETATLGIYIGDNAKRNKGYGFEAINLILDYGFNILNLHSINLTVAEFNRRGIALYKKCGFKEVGYLRDNRKVAGNYYSTLYMDILEDEYKSFYLKEEIEKLIDNNNNK